MRVVVVVTVVVGVVDVFAVASSVPVAATPPPMRGVATAHTAYGTCGIKVWIFKGEILEHDPMAQDKRLETSGQSRARANAKQRGPAPGARPPARCL